jgi:diguanylate cyclase (GGDEF)-like protein
MTMHIPMDFRIKAAQSMTAPEISHRDKRNKASMEITGERSFVIMEHNMLLDIIDTSILMSRLSGKRICVLAFEFMGIDQSSSIYGLGNTDSYSSLILKRFLDNVRDTDFLARVSENEFVMVLLDVTRLSEIKQICQRIISAVSSSLLYKNEAEVAISIGIAIASYDGDTSMELLSSAKIASQYAKASGHNQYAFNSRQFE